MSNVVLKVFSFGGGIQSVAALVLAARGVIDYNIFLFANTGDDSENPDTLKYVREVAAPFAARHGLHLLEVRRPGSTLYQHITRPGNRFAGIPMRLSNGKPGRRACTAEYKVAVVDQWLLSSGGIQQHLDAERDFMKRIRDKMRKNMRITPLVQRVVREKTYKRFHPLVLVGLGISTDEIHRARTLSPLHWKALDYPLLTLHLTRDDCVKIISDAGLPVPPKSACWFCPFRTLPSWRALRQNRPDLFEKAATFEENFNAGRRSKMWLTRKLIPLRLAVQPVVQDASESSWDMCESGHCWT